MLLAATVIGTVPAPSYENKELLEDICEITTGLELAFTRETLLVAGLPTVTDPKAMLVGVTVRLPAVALEVVAGTSPPQPVRAMQPLESIDPKTKYEA